MNTRFLLMAQYGGKAVIPLDLVRSDYFTHLTTEKLAHKISRGEIKLPMVRIEASQKAARGPVPSESYDEYCCAPGVFRVELRRKSSYGTGIDPASLRDRNIGGHYNNNFFFTTEEDALAFLED